MTVYLSTVEFENDFATIGLSDGSSLVLNKLDESFPTEEGNIEVKRINIEKVDYDEDGNETKTICTSIIGMSDDNVSIETDFTQYLGQSLTEENMIYCTLEV